MPLAKPIPPLFSFSLPSNTLALPPAEDDVDLIAENARPEEVTEHVMASYESMFDPPPVLLCGHLQLQWPSNGLVANSTMIREMKDVERIVVEFKGQEREKHPKTLGARKEIWRETATVWESPIVAESRTNAIAAAGQSTATETEDDDGGDASDGTESPAEAPVPITYQEGPSEPFQLGRAYEIPFTIAVPPDLPPTVHVAYGSVAYKLTATIQYKHHRSIQIAEEVYITRLFPAASQAPVVPPAPRPTSLLPTDHAFMSTTIFPSTTMALSPPSSRNDNRRSLPPPPRPTSTGPHVNTHNRASSDLSNLQQQHAGQLLRSLAPSPTPPPFMIARKTETFSGPTSSQEFVYTTTVPRPILRQDNHVKASISLHSGRIGVDRVKKVEAWLGERRSFRSKLSFQDMYTKATVTDHVLSTPVSYKLGSRSLNSNSSSSSSTHSGSFAPRPSTSSIHPPADDTPPLSIMLPMSTSTQVDITTPTFSIAHFIKIIIEYEMPRQSEMDMNFQYDTGVEDDSYAGTPIGPPPTDVVLAKGDGDEEYHRVRSLHVPVTQNTLSQSSAPTPPPQTRHSKRDSLSSLLSFTKRSRPLSTNSTCKCQIEIPVAVRDGMGSESISSSASGSISLTFTPSPTSSSSSPSAIDSTPTYESLLHTRITDSPVPSARQSPTPPPSLHLPAAEQLRTSSSHRNRFSLPANLNLPRPTSLPNHTSSSSSSTSSSLREVALREATRQRAETPELRVENVDHNENATVVVGQVKQKEGMKTKARRSLRKFKSFVDGLRWGSN
ncbi:hypothetical protein HK097_010434 [Rhizophlyctis rosea]|uniref:Arrestin C-terminal-like domain-containing protein n=1 Tax=Rhizophlyctis rosea TaxID=64517 RepID=A0AAD5S959_9FUNG|nr:hypothetical protein HK097_010434 [Rhizophlyctis rosea]